MKTLLKKSVNQKSINKGETHAFDYIVSSLFLLILLVGNFMGVLYLSAGNLAVSIIVSFLLVILYFFVIQLLVKNKEQMVRSNFMNFSIVFWLFYAALAVVSGFLFTHFLNVEFNAKNDIQESAYQKIAYVDESLVTFKERSNVALEDYESTLTLLVQKYKNDGANQVRQELEVPPYNINPQTLKNRSNINVKEMVNAHMAPYYLNLKQVEKVDENIKKFNNQYRRAFLNWNRFTLVNDYMTLNKHVESALENINKRMERLPIDNEPIEVNFDKRTLPLDDPNEFNKMFKPNYVIPLIIILGIHLFLLLPFFMKRIKKYTDPRGKRGQISDLTIEI